MHKIVKLMVALFSIAAALYLLLALSFTLFVNPNDYKIRIEHRLSTIAANHDVTIAGKIRWSFFPRLGINIEHITVASTLKSPSPPLLKVNSAHLTLRWLPLLHRKIAFHTINLYQPVSSLVMDAQGHTNWQPITTLSERPATTTDGAATKSTFAPHTFPFTHFNIIDGRINWLNQKTHHLTRLTSIALHLNHVHHAAPFNVKLAFQANSPLLLHPYQVITSSTIVLHPSLQYYQLNNLHIKIKEQPTQQTPITTVAEVNASITMKPHYYRIWPLTARCFGGMLHGNFIFDHRTPQPNYVLDLQMSGVNLKPLLQSDLIQGHADIEAHLKASGMIQKWQQQLDGTVHMVARHGRIKGINLPGAARTVYQLLSAEKLPQIVNAGDSPFSILSVSANLQHGIVNSHNLQLLSPELKASGYGRLNLATQHIDSHLNIVPQPGISRPWDHLTMHHPDISIPILVKGTLQDPTVQPDYHLINRWLSANAGDSLKGQLQHIIKQQKNSHLEHTLEHSLHHYLH